MQNSYTSNFKLFIQKLIVLSIIIILFFSISLEFYNPLLINKNKNITYTNNIIPELPKNIEVSYNNLGYIGEDYFDTDSRIKVCFIGSSRVQSIYIPLKFQWTNSVVGNKKRYWYNNMGQDGAQINNWISTISKLGAIKPDFIIVLVDPFNNFELDETKNSYLNINNITFISSIVKPLYKIIRSKILVNNIGHIKVNWNEEELEGINYNQPVLLQTKKIKKGLDELVKKIKKIRAVPILISCPTPYGNYINSNKIDIGKIKGSLKTDLFFNNFSKYLDFYCYENGIFYIDGYSLSKSTDFFYDYTHFNIKGSIEFSKMIKPKLENIFSVQYSKDIP